MIKETQNFSFKVRNIEIWNNPNYTFHLNFVGEKLFIILSVSVLSVSVSADMKIIISVLADKKIEFIGLNQYQPI